MIIGLLVRGGILIGAVYYSRKLGVWGNTEQTEKLYNDLKEEIRPHAQKLEKQLPFEVPALPETGEVRFLAKHYYNKGVKETFRFMELMPCYAGQGVQKIRDAYHSFSHATPPDANNAPANGQK